MNPDRKVRKVRWAQRALKECPAPLGRKARQVKQGQLVRLGSKDRQVRSGRRVLKGFKGLRARKVRKDLPVSEAPLGQQALLGWMGRKAQPVSEARRV